LTGEAVKITWVPSQIAPAGFAEMETETGSTGFTCMVIGSEVAGLPDWQDSDEVRMQMIWSPCLRVELLYVGALDPTLAPFSFHW
jgi:hypothetical protein